jgi:hypothetical protein
MKTLNSFALFVAVGAVGMAGSTLAQDHVDHYTSADGRQVTLTSGQPAPTRYGPAPDFGQLDANRDGSISREEAEAFTPLFNDFDHLAHHAERISQRQYTNWAKNEYRQ